MRIAVVVASLALAGAVIAQAQTGCLEVRREARNHKRKQSGDRRAEFVSNLTVSCNRLTGRISGRVSDLGDFFPMGKLFSPGTRRCHTHSIA